MGATIPSKAANLDDLLGSGTQEGISAIALDIMTAVDATSAINTGLGATPDDIETNSAIVVAGIYDNSGSIDGIKDGPESVCSGQRLYLNSLRGSKESGGIIMESWLINEDHPVQEFTLIENAVELVNGTNYSADGYTPLYRRTCEVLARMIAKIKIEFHQANIPCRGILLLVTDGEDADMGAPSRGRRFTAADVKKLVEEAGELLTFQFMYINDGTNPGVGQRIAESMGVKPHNVSTPSTSAHDIRQSFLMHSKSASASLGTI